MSQGPTRDVAAARYRHYCCWCGEEIEVGQPYRHYALFGESEVWVDKFHPECYAAMERVSQAAQDEIWWLPGDFKRGSDERKTMGAGLWI